MKKPFGFRSSLGSTEEGAVCFYGLNALTPILKRDGAMSIGWITYPSGSPRDDLTRYECESRTICSSIAPLKLHAAFVVRCAGLGRVLELNFFLETGVDERHGTHNRW